MYVIQQSTTLYPLYFLMISSTDHVSPATGLTPTVVILKAGGSFGSPSGAVTEIANGWYQVAGNATDTNTLGSLILHASSTGADDSDIVYNVVSYNPQDAVHLGLSSLPNAAAAASGGLPTVGTGSGQITLSSGDVTVGTNNDKTGYSLTQTFPTNFASMSINGSGFVTLADVPSFQKNTALNGFAFMMISSSDHITPLTGASVSAFRSLNGSGFSACANAVTEISSGWYTINLAASDVNGNTVALLFTAAGADNTNLFFTTNS
jgi:hypothetical protein